VNAATAMVSLAGLGVRYGAVTALRGVDLRVNRGDFIALVGANGSGKTTLLQALHGMVAHTGSRVVSELAAAQVMVFQRPFVLRLSVWNNLRLALWLAGVPARERASRAAQALQRAGLMELRDRPARALSGGQQQRLALARAVDARPKILVLDDTMSALDVETEALVEAALGKVLDQATGIIVAHRASTVLLADKVALLQHGTITHVGEHHELLATVPAYRDLLAADMDGPDGAPEDADEFEEVSA